MFILNFLNKMNKVGVFDFLRRKDVSLIQLFHSSDPGGKNNSIFSVQDFMKHIVEWLEH